MIYFISDLHFYHNKIIEFCNRPFVDVKQMNEELINRWNEKVNSEDEIYILGDFALKAKVEDVNYVLNRLNGRKYLILGNHDKYIDDDKFDTNCFVWIRNYYVLNYKDKKIILFHYPMIEWEGQYSGSILLYGHVHREDDRLLCLKGKRALNVCADLINYRPISIDEIFLKLNL